MIANMMKRTRTTAKPFFSEFEIELDENAMLDNNTV
jgi:hypothetical protein